MGMLPLWTDHNLYRVEYDEPEYARFEFDGLYPQKSGEIYAEVVVTSTDPNDEEVLIDGRLNLQAPMTIKSWAKDIAIRANGRGHLDWYGMLAAACQVVKRSYREGEPGVVLRDYDDSQAVDYLVSPLLLDNLPVMIYGFGGSGKSLLALALGALVNGAPINVGGLMPARTTRVALLDWEFDAAQHKDRLRSICGPDAMPDLFYLRCAGPLRGMVDRLRRLIHRERIGYVLIDSLVGALGDDPNDAAVVTGMFNALRTLNIGSLVVAHVTKGGDEDHPFGSIMSENMVRLMWLVKSQQAHGQESFDVTLTCKKKNVRGPWPIPLGLHMGVEGGRLTISRHAPDYVPQSNSARTATADGLKTRILDYLEDIREGTASQIAIGLGVHEDSVRVVVNRLAKDPEPAIERAGISANRQTIWRLPEVPW